MSSIDLTLCHHQSSFDLLTNNSNMLTEPTKEEEAAARTKEAAEQAALPYKWTQTIGDLDITVEVPGNLKGRDLNVDIKKKKLVLGVKGQEAIINVCSTMHNAYNLIEHLMRLTGRSSLRNPC
jgi:hypothetical protein